MLRLLKQSLLEKLGILLLLFAERDVAVCSMTKKQLAFNLDKLVKLVRKDVKACQGEFYFSCDCSQCLRVKRQKKRIRDLKRSILQSV